MAKQYDGYLTWSGLHGTNDATVRVRVFDDVRKNETKAIVILSEPATNRGTSVTNGIEQIVGRVLKDRGLWIDEVTIVEHYNGQPKNGAFGQYPSFNVVTFGSDEQTVDRFGGLMFQGPTWYNSTAAEVAAMIGANVRDVEMDRF